MPAQVHYLPTAIHAYDQQIDIEADLLAVHEGHLRRDRARRAYIDQAIGRAIIIAAAMVIGYVVWGIAAAVWVGA